ncbi:AMP-binding protein [Kitasatospora sp. LaBMicrA B282]|uniref:AMP-binding protein n=1 Tax=Kitasatospora sp. LaBMicrA B282 TaxID=3420949 RepID=UPI003D123EF6
MPAPARTPDAIALRDGEFTLTYRDLAAARDRIATELDHARIPRGTLVGLHLEPGWLTVTSILALRKHGCPYLPLHPGRPLHHHRPLLHRTGIRHLLTTTDDHLTVHHLP